MNKYSLDRGFGRCIVLKKFGVSLRKYGNRTNDRIVVPAPGPGIALSYTFNRIRELPELASEYLSLIHI